MRIVLPPERIGNQRDQVRWPHAGRRPLSDGLSVYLDVMRVGAALVVALQHVWPVLVPSLPIPWPGHSAVVVFFVLSGLLIARAADRPCLNVLDFVLRRLVRISSVAIPALALSFFVSAVIGWTGIGGDAPAANDLAGAVWRVAVNIPYLGQAWGMDVAPPLNAPFWSLNYEVWYYALFTAMVCVRSRLRIYLLVLGALVCGPKTLVLLPVWLTGVLLYRRLPAWSERTSLVVLAATGLGGLAFIGLNASYHLRAAIESAWPTFMSGLQASNQFLGDWLLGGIVAFHLAAAGSLNCAGFLLRRFKRPIRAAANCSFSLYLYHMPLLVLFKVGFQLPGLAIAGGLAASVWVLAQLTEAQVDRLYQLLVSRPARGGGRTLVQSGD